MPWAVGVFVVALGARMAFGAVRGPVLTPDSRDYISLARNLEANRAFSLDSTPPFTPTIRRAPLYPVVLTPFVRDGSLNASGVVGSQAVLDALVAVMILQLATWAAGLRVAAAAGLGYALHPGAIYFSANILSESLFTALLVGAVCALVMASRGGALPWSMLGGTLLGLAALCRPVALPLAVAIVGVWLVILRIPRRRLHSLALVGCAGMVVLPWAVRCTGLSGQLVLVQGASSTTFYVATLTDWDQRDQETLWARFSAEDVYGRSLGAARTPREMAEADRVGTRMALQNIRSDPGSYVRSRMRHLPYLALNSFDSFTGLNTSFGAAWAARAWLTLAAKGSLLLVFSAVPLLLGVAGLLGDWRTPAMALSAAVWVCTALVHAPTWIEFRFWVPAVPFLLVSAAVGLRLLAGRPGPGARAPAM
jgi:hypothetical protein